MHHGLYNYEFHNPFYKFAATQYQEVLKQRQTMFDSVILNNNEF